MQEKIKTQTAVEWLQNHLIVHFSEIEQQIRFKGLFEKAKENEKQKIINAYDYGSIDALKGKSISGKQFYKNNFKE